MITHQEIAAGADEGFQAALLMSFYHQDGGRARTWVKSHTSLQVAALPYKSQEAVRKNERVQQASPVGFCCTRTCHYRHY
jgi:hypothetical protein